MDKKKTLQFGMLVFICMLIWGRIVSGLLSLVLPNADLLTGYLFDKGLFAVLLLAVMSKFGGLKFFGFERGSSWWFLLPDRHVFKMTVVQQSKRRVQNSALALSASHLLWR